ncbi:hypothetical protein KCP71_21685 [Salmonella enterica subsp. enterica]|nr:hypothetical protein KCP71_21685 [Salmonella enterica subsp. enterica]
MTCGVLCPPAAPFTFKVEAKGAASRYGAGFRHIFGAGARVTWRWRDWRSSSTQTTSCGFSTNTRRCDNGFCRVLTTAASALSLLLPDNDNISYVFSHCNGRAGGFATGSASAITLRHRRIAFGNQLRLFINRRGNHFRMRCLDLDDFRRLWFGDSLRLNGNVFYRLYRCLWFERYGRSDNLLFSDNRLWQRCDLASRCSSTTRVS